MAEPKLVVRKADKAFFDGGSNPVRALDEISLEVHEGEIVSLIGPSGCGKSTLLDMAAGLTIPDRGDILLEGRSIIGKKGFVSYMPQKDVLFPWRNILDNVLVPLELQGYSRKAARAEARSLLPLFGLEGFEEKYPYALSGGMRQRASFLRTYLCRKPVMLLDEPFGKLDALTRRQMQHWLVEVWDKFKPTVLFVTHDVDEAVFLSDRIYVLSARPGRVVYQAKVEFPRPRAAELTLTEEFLKTKAVIFKALEEGAEI